MTRSVFRKYSRLKSDEHRIIEFEKGKAAITVPSLDKLPTVIDTLITAVRNGEFDEQLAVAGKVVAKRKAA